MSQTAELRRWTRKEYEMLVEAEFFHPAENLELVNGIVYQRPAQTSWHAGTIQAAQEALRSVFSTGAHVRTQMPLALTSDSEPVPDITVVPGHWRDYLSAHPATAVLVIEVSESSAHFDQEEKRQLYAAAGISEYWILYVKTKQLEVLRDPRDGDYRSRVILKPDDTIAPLAAPGSSIRVTDLLP